MLSTKGEPDGSGNPFIEILEFDVGNEEKHAEASGCKASVYAGFDDCPTTENLVEILTFTHFARIFKFNRTPENRKDSHATTLKKEISHGIKVSVVMELV